ncbi:hypothetical protein LTS02_017293 [Friedmanniomyces endolithicus]|nr:hypothetical protein LTS02_017293 [Friedmanniomyces endolithicus]
MDLLAPRSRSPDPRLRSAQRPPLHDLQPQPMPLRNRQHITGLAAWKSLGSGALGGLATFVVSAPTELVKCRAQVSSQSSLEVTKALWKRGKLRELYLGGGVTSVRDAVGYGF